MNSESRVALVTGGGSGMGRACANGLAADGYEVVLFNNAGTGAPPVPLEEISLEQWNRVVGVNLTGSFLCTQRAMKLMKSQSPMGGRIINNGSISAHVPRPNSAPNFGTVYRNQTCHYRSDTFNQFGRSTIQNRVRSDRHW